jgi:WD40 repeat protein/serine/threonine protein kinase
MSVAFSMPDPEDREEQATEAFYREKEEGREPKLADFLERFPDVADHVRELFAVDADITPFIPTGTAGDQITEEREPPVLLEYEILGKIDHGGPGIVYKAQHRKSGQIVALKMIRKRGRASADDIDRLVGEIRNVAGLAHPNIVPLYHLAEHDGEPFFTMQLMEGGSLASRLADYCVPRVNKKTRKDERGKVWSTRDNRKRQVEIARLLIPLAQAIDHALQRCILHCDLKPANILLDGFGHPYIADFGLAVRIDPSAPGLCSNGIAGTAVYMAPEQTTSGKQLTGAVDVYGLGAILYELLTGRPPFQGEHLLDILRQVREDEPPKPRTLNPSVNRDLEAICLKCLHKAPDKRYSNAKELAGELTKWVEGRPINKTRRVGRGERLIKWMKRRPAIAGLSSALVFLTVFGVYAFAYEYLQVVWTNQELEQKLYLSRIIIAANHIAAKQYGPADEILDQCPQHLRRWEWNYLKRRCHFDYTPLRGDGERLETIQFSSDGLMVATGDRGGHVKIWNALTGKLLKTLDGHHGFVYSVCFTGDNRKLITADSNQVMRIWDVRTWEKLLEVPDAGDHLAASLNGDLVAVRSDRVVKVFDTRALNCVWTLPDQESKLISIALSPKDEYLAVGGYNRLFNVYDLRRRNWAELVFTTDQNELYNVWAVAFAADGRSLAAAKSLHLGDTQLATWKLEKTGFQFESSYGGSGELVAGMIGYSYDGTQLAASDRESVRVWDTRTHKSVPGAALKHTPNQMVAFGATPSAWRLALVANRDVIIEDVYPQYNPVCRTLRGHVDQNLATLAFEENGKYLISRAGANEVIRWDVDFESFLRFEAPHAKIPEPSHVVIALDGQFCIAASTGERLQVWDASTGKATTDLVVPFSNTCQTAVSPNGSILALTNTSNDIVLWDMTLSRLIRSWNGSLSSIRRLAFFHDSKRLASCDAEDLVRVWDADTGARVIEIHPHEQAVTGLAICPDDRHIATCSADGTVRVWDAKTGDIVHKLESHREGCLCVTYSPDGKRLVSGSVDGSIQIWDAESGQELLTFDSQDGKERGGAHEGAVTALAFNRMGTLLASGGRDGVIRVWDARPVPPLEDSP